MFTPGALRYDHPMMRRLDVATWVVTDPMGRAVTYGRDGFPVGADVAADSRLEALPDGTVREVFADRSEVIYGATGEVARTVSRGGVVAASETETIDSTNGNAVVGGMNGGRTTFAATRVASGNGLGRIASRTDERGLTTAYTYDAYGRTLTRTEMGASTTVTSYVYAADPFDRRPWRTTEAVDGVVVRVATFAEAELLDGGRVEVETDCGLATRRIYWPADAENRFAAGRLRAERRPDGRMTAYD